VIDHPAPRFSPLFVVVATNLHQSMSPSINQSDVSSAITRMT